MCCMGENYRGLFRHLLVRIHTLNIQSMAESVVPNMNQSRLDPIQCVHRILGMGRLF